MEDKILKRIYDIVNHKARQLKVLSGSDRVIDPLDIELHRPLASKLAALITTKPVGKRTDGNSSIGFLAYR